MESLITILIYAGVIGFCGYKFGLLYGLICIFVYILIELVKIRCAIGG